MIDLKMAHLLNAMAGVAYSRFPELGQRWVNLSGQFSGGDSHLMLSMQRVGRLDLILRCVEEEIAPTLFKDNLPEADQPPLLAADMAVALSNSWILEAYEIVRLRRDRIKGDGEPDEALEALYRRLSLVRIPLAKGEIAGTNKHRKRGTAHRPTYMLNLATGSAVWAVLDKKTGQYVEIVRRDLADEMLAFAKAEAVDSMP